MLEMQQYFLCNPDPRMAPTPPTDDLDKPPSTPRPARRRTDIAPGERRGTTRTLEDRALSNTDSPLESLGKAISTSVIEAAEEDEKTR